MSVVQAGRRRLAGGVVAPLVALLALACSGCGGCGGSETLDSALGQAWQEAQSALDSGQESVDGGRVAAASQVQVALEDARAAWSAQLQTSVDNLSSETSRQLDQLQQMTDELGQDTKSGTAAAATSAHLFTRTLTVENGAPQVSGFGPESAAAGGAVPIRLRVRGNFLSASRRGYRPALRAGDTPAPLKENTTQWLGFDVPVSPTVPRGRVGALPVTLTVPYWDRPDDQRRTATYRLTLSVLPASPGSVSIKTMPAVPRGHVRRQVVSATARADSSYARADVTRPVGPVFADPRCRLDTGSARLVVTWSHGRPRQAWTREWVRQSPLRVEGKVSAFWRGRYASGAVDAHIEVAESCPLTVVGRGEVVPRLRWGDEARFSVARASRWSVFFAPFHGTSLDLGGTESTARTPFLEVTCCSPRGEATIRAPDVGEIQW